MMNDEFYCPTQGGFFYRLRVVVREFIFGCATLFPFWNAIWYK